MVIQDYRGDIVRAHCWVRRGCLTPVAAESVAALQAIEMCCERRFTNVHFEGDAKTIIEAVKCAGIDGSKLGHLVEDMRVKLQSLTQWKMSHVK